MEVNQHFNKVQSLLNLGETKRSIEDFSLNGDSLSFSIQQSLDGNDVEMLFEGKVAGDNINGALKLRAGESEEEYEWKARRIPLTYD